MIKLELTRLEHNDIIEYLKYAQKQKQLNQKKQNETGIAGLKFDTTIYDINRINQLIEILNFRGSRTNIYKSSANMYLSKEERYLTYYEKRKKDKDNSEGLIKVL